MSDRQPPTTTITEQIYALMLTELAADEVFDAVSLARLQALVEEERLANRNALLKAIKAQPEAKS